MSSPSFANGYSLHIVAETSDRICGFDPHVPAMLDDGRVLFQAALTNGRTGVFCSSEGSVESVIESTPATPLEICSHPDQDSRGHISFYAKDATGACRGFRFGDGALSAIGDNAGPLGPTMNAAGVIAFRAQSKSGASGNYRTESDRLCKVAETGDHFAAFHGLPVVNDLGHVLFRADLVTGVQGIFLACDEKIETIATTEGQLASLSYFPACNQTGTIVFCASLRTGGSAVMVVQSGHIEPVLLSEPHFESLRGALIDDEDRVVFFGTPIGGQLGIYFGPNPRKHLLLGIGSSLFGSTVTEFALNPVSINPKGQLAIRLTLADQRQLILRADPK